MSTLTLKFPDGGRSTVTGLPNTAAACRARLASMPGTTPAMIRLATERQAERLARIESRSAAANDAETRSVEFRATPSADGVTLEGYAAVFDQPAEIDDWQGRFVETFRQGAFSKTIRDHKPVLMFNHGQHPTIGDLPIGVIDTLREDGHGLHVKAKLNESWLVDPVREAIKNGSITGMSVRMSVTRDKWGKEGNVRTRSVDEVKLLELGPVVFPAYEGTSVSARSQGVNMSTRSTNRLRSIDPLRSTDDEVRGAALDAVDQRFSRLTRHRATNSIASSARIRRQRHRWPGTSSCTASRLMPTRSGRACATRRRRSAPLRSVL